MTTPSTSRALLAQSDLLLLIADAFRAPPQSVQRLAETSPCDVTELACAALPRQPGLPATLGELLAAARSISDEDASAEYHRLFEGGMPCPLNETAYVRRDKGAILGDVCAFYRAFGWQPAEGTAEKPDHLVCELEFVALLLVMLAAAEQEQRPEAREVTRTALDRFADAHLGDWLPAVCARLRECAASAFYQALGAALAALWEALAAEHGWSTASTATPLPILEPESPYECIVPGRSGHEPED